MVMMSEGWREVWCSGGRTVNWALWIGWVSYGSSRVLRRTLLRMWSRGCGGGGLSSMRGDQKWQHNCRLARAEGVEPGVRCA